MPILKAKLPVKRYFVRGEFNPRSPAQLLNFMLSKGHEGGTAKGAKTDKPSTNKKVLETLAKKDPFYRDVLDHRSVSKVKATYVDGVEARLDPNDRLHAQFLHKPSTFRLSARNPNLQNVVADKEDKPGEKSIASGFRNCIVASEGCVLLEADFAAIEALLVGWLIRDPRFMRLASLGIHGWHASTVLGTPVNLNQPDYIVGAELKKIKKANPVQYNKSKITIYGSLYAQSPYGLQKTYPETFETVQDAAKNQELLYQLCPNLKKWHGETQLFAHKNGYLSNVWNHRHWFWDVFTWNSSSQSWKPGSQSKATLAFGPQSIGYGAIAEAAIRVAPRIEHCFKDGLTPLRALIHDSILVEVKLEHKNYAAAVMKEEMSKAIPQLPCPPEWGFGEYLSIGVAVKAGLDWANMEEFEPELGVASDLVIRELEDEDLV